jgi:hypothetical protein
LLFAKEWIVTGIVEIACILAGILSFDSKFYVILL